MCGFFDGEGSALWYDKNGRHHSHKVSACNTDIGVIDTARRYLSNLGISYNARTCLPRNKKHKRVYIIDIMKGVALTRFQDTVGFKHSRKRQTLRRIVNWVNRPRSQTKNLNIEMIAAEYASGKSYRQIAKSLGFKSGESIRLLLLRKRIDHKARTKSENFRLLGRNELGQIISRVE